MEMLLFQKSSCSYYCEELGLLMNNEVTYKEMKKLLLLFMSFPTDNLPNNTSYNKCLVFQLYTFIRKSSPPCGKAWNWHSSAPVSLYMSRAELPVFLLVKWEMVVWKISENFSRSSNPMTLWNNIILQCCLELSLLHAKNKIIPARVYLRGRKTVFMKIKHQWVIC